MGTEETLKKESAPPRKVRVINETPDSNPQLAEKLSLLSDALHMDLELVEQEAWIGHYNGDILPHDQRNDAAVVIEHHSDETYHYQLGQVLACAENYDARILIWIADNLREEHRAALDWLNRWTPEVIQVFGVELHTTEKSDSEANLKFAPVVFPKGWSKSGEGKPIPVKIQSVVLREFFRALADDLIGAGFMNDQNIVTKHDQPFPSGLPGVNYHASFEGGNVVWVYISAPQGNKSHIFKTPRAEREAIEGELKLASDAKTEIVWTTGAGNIGIWRYGSTYDSEEELEDIRKWMSHYLLKFKEIFNPRMKKIISELENSDE